MCAHRIFKRFKDLIKQDRENFTVDNKQSPKFLYSDLCLIVGQPWLIFEVFEVMETSVKIFNQGGSNFTKIQSFNYLVDFETNGKLKESTIATKMLLELVDIFTEMSQKEFLSSSHPKTN